MPPVGWLHRHLRMSPAFLTRLSPPGLTATQTVRGELRLPNPCKEPATEPLRKLTRASPGRSREPSGPHRVPPGTHRTSGFHRTPPGVHRTPPGVHRRITPSWARPFEANGGSSETQSTTCGSLGRLRLSNGVVVRHRASSDAHGTSGFHRDSFGRPTEAGSVQTRRYAAIASFR